MRTLREQLEAERRANEENRRLLAALIQRVPELEAPEPAPEKPAGPAASEAREEEQEPSEALGGPRSGTARGSWWRRIFEGGK
jgi:hypothetical protein